MKPKVSSCALRLSILPLVLGVPVGPTPTANAQDPVISEPANTSDDLAHGHELLKDIRDNVFSFDDPAFYWFCRYVKDQATLESFTIESSESAVSWKFLLERPSDYRGKPVVIEGVLMTRTGFIPSGYGREGIGRIYQCELGEIGTQALCAVITIEDPSDLPIRSRVRAKGFFIKVRSYRSNQGQTGAGPLVVARRLELSHPPTARVGDSAFGSSGTGRLLVFGTAILAVVWILVRRRLRRTAGLRRGSALPAADTPPTDEDFTWLTNRKAAPETELRARDESKGSSEDTARRTD